MPRKDSLSGKYPGGYRMADYLTALAQRGQFEPATVAGL
jgi:hypothetical protein